MAGGVDPSLGVNNFGKAKIKNESESVANALLNLLFARPGSFPSMPNLGIDLPSIMYQFWDTIEPDVLKAKIAAQCERFQFYVDNGELNIQKSSYMDKPLLIIVLPVQIKNVRQNLAIGVTIDGSGNTKYNYIIDDVVE